MEVRLTKNRFPELKGLVRRRVIDTIHRHALNVASIAYQLCPVSDNDEPGHVHTRDTIAVSESKLGTVRVVAGGAATYLEHGTVNMDAQPFLRPAVEADRPELLNDLSKIFEGENETK